jgi:DNA-binding Lrp family transcriptional regulator
MQQLEENARQSYTEIGKKVGLSNETVEYRINKMLETGLIQRMFAEPNLTKLGLKTYRVYFKMENLNETKNKEFFSYLSNHPRVQWFGEFEGEWDYTVRYALSDENEFKTVLEELFAKFGKYIKAKDIVITTYQRYLPATHLTGTERKEQKIYKTKDSESVDETDRKILFYLFENARMKSVEIADKIKISPDAVQYRIKRLVERGVISAFTTWFDRRKLGYEYYKVLLWFQYITPEEEQKIMNYCEQHPNIVFINRVLGNWDLELDFDAKNSKEIHDMIKDLKGKFSEVIREHATLTVLRDAVQNPFRIQ